MENQEIFQDAKKTKFKGNHYRFFTQDILHEKLDKQLIKIY